MYGIWNSMKKEFQFGISEETVKKAKKKLFKKIGYDSYKWRFEIKKIMGSDQSPRRNKMKTYSNYATTVAATGDFEVIKPGGYICKILKVTCTEKPYGELLTMEIDIAEGELKGFYKRRFDNDSERDSNKAKWKGMLYQTVMEEKLQFFKGFITNIEASNSGFKWNDKAPNENDLVGKLFGGVFGEEEFDANGEVKMVTKCVKVTTVENIKKGVPVPEIKRLPGYQAQSAAFSAQSEDSDELPF